MSVFIIAEAGVNHNGDIQLAYELIDKAVEAGVDAIKFQIFKAENVVTKSAIKAKYQSRNTQSDNLQLSMLKALELTFTEHFELKQYCDSKNIEYLSTAFDAESLDFLINDIKPSFLKIASGEITNGPLLLQHAMAGKPVIISSGMSSLKEIEEALAIIAFALINRPSIYPTPELINQAYCSERGQALLKEKVTLLHCTTEYPAPLDEVNLKAMETMQASFGLNVGYSDHTEGIAVPIAAVAMGAKIIEKHFTLDKSLRGPDHAASIEPAELTEMVKATRAVEKAKGSSMKLPTISELCNRDIARRSIVAAQPIKAGEKFTASNLSTKRPGSGLSPMQYWQIIGKTSDRDYQPDDAIKS